MRTGRLLLLAALLGVARAGEPAGGASPGGAVAARVDGVAIGVERLDRFFEDYLAESGRSAAAIRHPATFATLRRQALDRLVDAELLWQEARRRGLLATDAQVDGALAELRARYPRPGELERRLQRGGFTAAGYRAYLHQQLSIRRLVQEEVVAGITASPAEALAEREANAPRYAHLPEAQATAAARAAVQDRKERAALDERVRALRARATIETGGSS